MSTGRKFAELNIETGKRDLEDVPLVEALPRYGSAGEAAVGEEMPQLPNEAASA
jgi:DNA recombination protein RmuC